MRHVYNGNIVDDDAELLVNTVNCVGVMGKGVALAFRLRWPGSMRGYQQACQDNLIKPGDVRLYHLPDGRRWAAMATKDHWRWPSRTTWVENGLVRLHNLAVLHDIHSIAMPLPGCGNGGLNRDDILPMVRSRFHRFDLRLYV